MFDGEEALWEENTDALGLLQVGADVGSHSKVVEHISKDEWVEAFDHLRERIDAKGLTPEEVIQKLDKDADGKASPEELAQAVKALWLRQQQAVAGKKGVDDSVY